MSIHAEAFRLTPTLILRYDRIESVERVTLPDGGWGLHIRMHSGHMHCYTPNPHHPGELTRVEDELFRIMRSVS